MNIRTSLRISTAAACLAATAAAATPGIGRANTTLEPDFSNPAVAMSRDAVIASGTCIAKYAALLDDGAKPAAEIGQRVAKRCTGEIARSAGLSSLLVGRPEDYAKNRRYLSEDLTTNAVVRMRAAKHSAN